LLGSHLPDHPADQTRHARGSRLLRISLADRAERGAARFSCPTDIARSRWERPPAPCARVCDSSAVSAVSRALFSPAEVSRLAVIVGDRAMLWSYGGRARWLADPIRPAAAVRGAGLRHLRVADSR